MYSICSLEQNDVLNSIIAMKQRGYRGPVVQTTDENYERLKYQKGGVREFADTLLRESTLHIDLLQNTLHTTDCGIMDRIAEKEMVHCYLIDIGRSGLKLCECCQNEHRLNHSFRQTP